MKNTMYLALALMLALYTGCGQKSKEEKNKHVTEEDMQPENNAKETTSDWMYLFDGKDADGWRSYNGEGLPEGWIVEEGTLKSLGKGGDIGGDIVYGKQAFENFELYLEWKISEGGNSGIFYHVQEGEQYQAAYENAPEYQLLDDLGFSEPLEGWQKVGADYAMYPANPDQKIVKPANEWNNSRIVFTPDKVSYWLNDKEVVSFVPWSEAWKARKAAGKWNNYPDYGKFKKGFIGLQDHGHVIWFKNIKIKVL